MSAPTPIVAGWLNIATKGLPLVARERISLEINTHFEEARERHRAEGLDEAQALVTAMQELGDPEAAARRFRRNYLTENDCNSIKFELHSGVCLVRGLAFSAELLFLSLLKFERPDVRAECRLAAVFCLGLTLALCFLTTRRMPRRFVSAVLLVSILMDCILAGAVYASLREIGNVAALSMLFYMAISGPRLRLLLKIRRTGDVWQEMPPLVKN